MTFALTIWYVSLGYLLNEIIKNTIIVKQILDESRQSI